MKSGSLLLSLLFTLSGLATCIVTALFFVYEPLEITADIPMKHACNTRQFSPFSLQGQDSN